METLTAKVTPRLLLELDHLIEEGWFASRSEAVRAAIRILVDSRHLSLMKAAVKEDITWGLHRE